MPPQPWEAGAVPTSSPGNPPVGTWTVGFLMAGTPGGRLTVMRVLPGSNAEQLGVRAGDEVVELDGTPAAKMNPAIARAAATRGTPFPLILQREGKRIELSVMPYQVR
jgi:S1-C subfamily serine protease